MSIAEWIATICGIVYLVLIAKTNRWGWIFGIVSCLIIAIVSWQQQLFYQAFLQGLYVLLGVYGFVSWNKSNELRTSKLSRNHLILTLIIGTALSVALFLLAPLSQKAPMLDAVITSFAIIATVLSARMILENWLFWIPINVLSVVLFYEQDLKLFADLYFINLVMAIWGYFLWKIEYEKKV